MKDSLLDIQCNPEQDNYIYSVFGKIEIEQKGAKM